MPKILPSDRRQDPVRSGPYAAELLLDEVPVPDDFESEDVEDADDELVELVELVELDGLASDVVVAGFGADAGELLDEELRLSLR
ncbi:hypothetical protein M2271_005756 [Streptomyces sp. LBL]|nr:hypothetical protein [Streptomyces sp. LBL]